jgi:hypothetical protein
LAVIFLTISFLVKILPGGYFPPFFGGIAGWAFKSVPSKTVTLSGLKLVRKDGEEVWYSGGLVSPQAFFPRQYLAFQDNNEYLKSLLKYYFNLYEYHYPYLKEGIFSYQRVLGSFTFPGHVTYTMMPYKDFSPMNISQICYVAEIFNRENRHLERKIIYYDYDVKNEHLNRYE